MGAFAGSYHDFSELNFQQEAEKKIATIKIALEERPDEILALGLNNNKMTSTNFTALTETLSLEKFTTLTVLDISDNSIDVTAAGAIAKWLDLPSNPYIKLTGTPLALKKVGTFYDRFTQVCPEKAKNFMKRVIFISQNYINTANTSVAIYQTLKTDKKIPDDWAQIHHDFYKNAIFKRLLKERELNQFKMVERRIQQLSLSQPPSPQRASVDNEGLEKSSGDKETMTFSQALNSVTFQ
jgi:hypothetical protein